MLPQASPHLTLHPHELSLEIKEESRRLGFQKCGIVRAETLKSEARRLGQWLDRGYHGEMQWMARDPEKRTDPRAIFPAARSVVVTAVNYYTRQKHSDAPGTGKVSCYAWGDDYHQVVGSKLHQLLAWIKEQVPQAEGKMCVDIQPVMDKAWAVRAGLGWLGKHTNVITPEFGSWVFIGELLLNLELEYEAQPAEDHCGSCTLCIDACPTAALTEPYVLDANRCISYATIELRSAEIPAAVGDKLEGWLYGCDICQDVCPWNRFEQVSEEEAFQPRSENVDVDLHHITSLMPDEYARRFKNSAMKRAKISGLQRNAHQLLRNETQKSI